jgi:predicted transcriptional regulator YdeE
MKPRIVDCGQITLVGLGFFGDPFRIRGGWSEENEIGRLWSRFMAILEARREGIKHVNDSAVFYEVHIQHEGTAQSGEFEIFVGLEVAEVEDVPVELCAKVLPDATYAVFTLQGEEITSDWHHIIYTQWMAESGYRSAHPFGFQRYDERFKGLDRIPDSMLDVYVPISRAEEAPHSRSTSEGTG